MSEGDRITNEKLAELRRMTDGKYTSMALAELEDRRAIGDGMVPGGPVQLNEVQERTVKEWAADDRLWTTQETVEFNLRTFARAMIAATERET